jgi:beta-fructofuranosidase
MSIFYKPSDGWAADVIPFYWKGEYHLFYLKDYRDRAGRGEGTPWWHLGTRDFVSFSDYGEALPRGKPDDQDLYVFTGSVTEADGRFHIFYTGHNPYFRKGGRPEQGVMHAVSDDLLHWIKVPRDTFYSPQERYEAHDWRDPFVFWNESAGEWWMLLAARLKEGLPRRRGCTALCTSKDLRGWQVQEPLYAPGLYFTHECPDLFRLGDWWYLVFSEFSQACLTRYRMSRSSHGPWLTPADDAFDVRALYAAKTASDGQRRFLFGWNPTREGEKDSGSWQWGGNIVVHEIRQDGDGALSVRPPETVEEALHHPLPVAFSAGVGDFTGGANGLSLNGQASFACASAGSLPDTCRIEAGLIFSAGTPAFGMFLRLDEAFEAGYYLRFEPARQRVVFDAWPRAGDIPYQIGLERPLALAAGKPVRLKAFIDGPVLEIYLDDQIALSARMYDRQQGSWGFFVEAGELGVEGVEVGRLMID